MILSTEKTVKEKSQIGDLLLAVVRGEAPVDALGEIGIEIVLKDDGFYSLKSALDVEVTPTVADLAIGILRYRAEERDALRKWAFFLLAETAIDFSKIESHPQGELLISSLWDASFEGRITSEAIAAAEAIKRDYSEID
jgi:hypothetical protein